MTVRKLTKLKDKNICEKSNNDKIRRKYPIKSNKNKIRQQDSRDKIIKTRILVLEKLGHNFKIGEKLKALTLFSAGNLCSFLTR